MTDFKTKMAELAAKYNISHKRDIDWHNFVAEVEELTHPELRESEDEKMLEGTLMWLDDLEKQGEYVEKERSWLKSLRPSWKPSEEQMKALQWWSELPSCSPGLISLYEDLKKLI